jgi:uncharacterized protein involved in response to NO
MQQIEIRPPPGHIAFLNLGFRPFFTLAAVFAVLSMLAWTGVMVFGWQPEFTRLPATTWHAHEMIYGYALAVIAGFLLTAVKNWTGIQTLHGVRLLLLLLPWLAARLLLVTGAVVPMYLIALLDCLFMTGLIGALLAPVIKVRQWKHLGIISKLLLLLLSNGVFYAGALGIIEDGIRIGLYSGVYLIIALILVMGRRVMPMFIANGVGYPVQLKNRPWLDIASLVLFLAFWIADIVRPDTLPVALLALTLMVLHAIRLTGWYTPGIWKIPLLWVLYVGYGWLISGFALKAAVVFFGIAPFLPLHAFAYGGIGMITVGMMARVTLGHTGRNVFAPPPVLFWIFTLLLAGAVIRVPVLLVDPLHYPLWIGLSQGLWIVAFSLFLAVFLPMLIRPRIDGQPG